METSLEFQRCTWFSYDYYKYSNTHQNTRLPKKSLRAVIRLEAIQVKVTYPLPLKADLKMNIGRVLRDIVVPSVGGF